MQPRVAVGMVEVPMGIDEVRDRVSTELRKSLGDLRARYADPGIDEHLAIRARQDGDVSAGALEDADIVSQLVRHYGRHRGAILDQADDAARFGKCLARRRPSARWRVSRTTDAAEAKAASRQQFFL